MIFLKIEVVHWTYKSSSGGSLVQGVKRGRAPRNAVQGGYGSFIVSDPPQVIATMQDDAGNCETVDVYPTLKRRLRDAGADRLTQKRANAAMEYYQSLGLFEAEEWYDLPDIPYGMF